MDRTSPTAGDFAGLGNDFSNLSLSTSMSPAASSSCNCSFFLPDDLFHSPHSSPPPPNHHTSPHPFAANADSCRRRQHPPSPHPPFAANADSYHRQQRPPSPHPPFAANADDSYHRQQRPPSPHPFAANADSYHRQQRPPSPHPFAANADSYHRQQRPPSPHPFAANADSSNHRRQHPPSPHPFTANADSYHRQHRPPSPDADSYYRRRQFAQPYTASSDNRLHRIPEQTIQFLNLSLLHGDHKYVAVFFPTVLNEVKNLILDRHDFRVLERFINACDELQRARLLAALAADTRALLRICYDKNGSAILAILIKHSRSWQQISQILSSLSPFVLDLAKSKTGSDILKCCLNHPYFDRDEYILQPIVKNWDQLACDKYGVFIVKQVVDLTTGDNALQLLTEIAQSTLELAQHPSGNYLVQHLLEKRIWPLTSSILLTLSGQFANLSTQKYSSNVVETCLKNTTSDDRESIIRELLRRPNVLDIYVDMYGNYVIQCALDLSVAKGEVHQKLLDVLKKNLPTVRQCGYYRRFIKKYEKYWKLEGFF